MNQPKTSPHPQAPTTKSMRSLVRAKKALPVSAEERQRIAELHQNRYGLRRIAKAVVRDRKTVRQVLQEQGLVEAAEELILLQGLTPASKLDSFREVVTQKVNKRLTTSRILREIRELGYTGGRTILAELVREIRAPLAPSRRAKRRFETEPGREMQVDWSPYIVPIAGKLTSVHVLAVVLAHSRKVHVHFYPNEREATLLEGLARAFEDFEGVARFVVFDNMSTVVLGRIGPGRKPVWHPRFRDFARYYGFAAFLCRVRDPDRKGKDERILDYLEKDFVRGSEFHSFVDLNQRAHTWASTIANVRDHGTTRLVPDEVWLAERDFLIKLPETRFATHDDRIQQVGPDSTLSVKGTLYTVPERLHNRAVAVRLYAEHFEVIDPKVKDKVAFSRRYVEAHDKGKLQIDPSHYAPLNRRLPEASGSRPDEILLKRFPGLAVLVAGIQTRMKSLAPVHLNALLRLAAAYGDEAFLTAASRAQEYRRFTSLGVRRILERDYPLADLATSIVPLGESARALSLIAEVEPGSFESFAHLDTALPQTPALIETATPTGQGTETTSDTTTHDATQPSPEDSDEKA